MNTNRDRSRCYRCGEYDHFAQECPNTSMDDEMGHSDSEKASLQILTQDSLSLNFNGEVEYFKLIKVKDGTTSFLPVESKTGGKISYIKNRETMCLSEKQADYVYKKLEEGKVINVNMLKQRLKQDLDRKDDNPYKKVVLNKVYRDEGKISQVENWSIFTDQIKYIHHDERAPHRLDLHPLDYQLHKELYCKLKREEGNSSRH